MVKPLPRSDFHQPHCSSHLNIVIHSLHLHWALSLFFWLFVNAHVHLLQQCSNDAAIIRVRGTLHSQKPIPSLSFSDASTRYVQELVSPDLGSISGRNTNTNTYEYIWTKKRREKERKQSATWKKVAFPGLSIYFAMNIIFLLLALSSSCIFFLRGYINSIYKYMYWCAFQEKRL